jgi:hypothetical protein
VTRDLAIVQTAIYDAVNAVDHTSSVFHVQASAPADASPVAAADAAGLFTASALFPTDTALFQATYQSALADVPAGQAQADGLAVGRFVAEQTLISRVTDGANALFRIDDNHTGLSTVYDVNGHREPTTVEIPLPPGSTGTSPSAPDGTVLNTTSGFVISEDGRSAPASSIFATEDGTIAAWNSQVDRRHALLEVDNSAAGAVFKALTRRLRRLQQRAAGGQLRRRPDQRLRPEDREVPGPTLRRGRPPDH